MASQPHDKSNKTCYVCGKVFDKASMTLSIRRREGGFIIRHSCCGKCYNDHYSKEE